MKSMFKCVEQGATDDRPYGIDVGKGTSWAPSPTHTNAKKATDGRPY